MASSCDSSYASSLETTNYARICRIVVDVLRDILWQVLTNEILPTDLPQKVQIDIKKLGNLNLKIKTWLCGISPPSTEIPSTEKFDVSSLYTLIRNLCSQVPTPSTQWGQIPPTGGITLGDDIERIREFRNTLYGHATQAKIENADFNKLCKEIKDVASRFDAYFCSLSKAMKCDFQYEIDTILTCFMDKSLEDDYIEKIKEIAILSDGLIVVKQQVGDLTKRVDSVHDAIYDLQKDEKENAEDSRNRLCRIQETLDMLHMEKGKFDSVSEIPPEWDPMDKGNLKLILLQPASKEYTDVASLFMATVKKENASASVPIAKIERIQNRTLYAQYQSKKKLIDEMNPGQINEMDLWHGTAGQAVDSINVHGFNRSFCGKNATMYGNGVYFVKESYYSARDLYSSPDAAGNKRMYLTKVLTGKYALGRQCMRVPPPLAPGRPELHDSVVDDINTPFIFVIFHDTQAYPKYLITFKWN